MSGIELVHPGTQRTEEVFDLQSDRNDEFGFGIEGEFLLLNAATGRPLRLEELDFQQLRRLVDGIPADDISSDGLNIKPLHVKACPFLIEGYYLTDSDMKPTRMLPKGIEIRTPIAATIEDSIDTLKTMFERLQERLRREGLSAAVISHHPTASDLEAPQNYRRHDYWQWALTAATTYGPDINISLPRKLSDRIDRDHLARKINHYLPPLIALTLNSPFYLGDLWRVGGRIGKSIRTFRRSRWAPLCYIHEKPRLRYEFKGFEMSPYLSDYQAMFLVSLAILLDGSLDGRATELVARDELREIAIAGLAVPTVRKRASIIIESARATARKLGFGDRGLDVFAGRLEGEQLPANEIISTFETKGSINGTMRTLTHLSDGQRPGTGVSLKASS